MTTKLSPAQQKALLLARDHHNRVTAYQIAGTTGNSLVKLGLATRNIWSVATYILTHDGMARAEELAAAATSSAVSETTVIDLMTIDRIEYTVYGTYRLFSGGVSVGLFKVDNPDQTAQWNAIDADIHVNWKRINEADGVHTELVFERKPSAVSDCAADGESVSSDEPTTLYDIYHRRDDGNYDQQTPLSIDNDIDDVVSFFVFQNVGPYWFEVICPSDNERWNGEGWMLQFGGDDYNTVAR